MVAGAVRGGLRDCHTMTAVKSLNRMSQVWDNSTVSAVQCWGLAQSVEHAAVNRSVVGSNPTFPVSLSVAGSPERQGVRQHDVHYVLPWPPGLSPGVSNRLLAYHQIHFLTIPRGNTGYFVAILSNLV